MVCTGIETNTPIAEHGEQKRAYEEVREGNNGVCQNVCAWSVEAIHAFADKDLAFFEESRNTCDRHKGEEGYRVEMDRKSIILGVGESTDVS